MLWPQTGVMSTTQESTGRRRLPALIASVRDELAARRAAQAERERLAAELADFASPADRNDLNALLDTYPDEDAAEVRALLNRGIAA